MRRRHRVVLDATALFSAAYLEGSSLIRLWSLAETTLCTSAYALAEAVRNLDTDERRERALDLCGDVEIHGFDPDAGAVRGVVVGGVGMIVGSSLVEGADNMRTVQGSGLSRRSVAAMALVSSVALVSSSGCNNAAQGAASGAGIGALSGLAIGSLTGSAGKGAAIGAIGGAVAGGVIGDQNERNANR